jgi:hypothetical protein
MCVPACDMRTIISEIVRLAPAGMVRARGPSVMVGVSKLGGLEEGRAKLEGFGIVSRGFASSLFDGVFAIFGVGLRVFGFALM